MNKEREETVEQLRESYEQVVDLESLPPVTHNWVDRGEVMSCEGAAHQNHRAFKRK